MNRNTVRSAIAATMLGAAAFGLVGGAAVTSAAPLNDPKGLCDNHDAAGDCLYGYAGPSHSVDVTLPANSPQEQAIVDYVNTAIDEFEADSGPLGTLDNPLPAEAFTAKGTRYSSAGTQSVVVALHEELRTAAHPASWFKSFNVSNATQAPLTFDGLFRPGTRPLEVIMPIVAQQLSTVAGQPLTIDPALGLDPANYQSFAVTDDAVIFFFDINEIHSAFDASEVVVPRSAIADLLNPGI